MAKVKFASPVSALRGSVGGVVFSANKASSYVKGRRMPTMKNSLAASNSRLSFSLLPELWRDLSDEQRDDWATFAALPAQEKTNSLGESYYCTGFQWFVALNNRLLGFYQSPLGDPPAGAKPTAPTVCLFDLINSTAGGSNIAFLEFEFEDVYMMASVALYNTNTQTLSESDFKICVREDYPVSTPVDIQSQVEAVWGTLRSDQSFLFRFYRVDDNGQLSTPYASYGKVS